MNPSFNTAHSTPSTTKKSPSFGGFSTISDKLGVPRRGLKPPTKTPPRKYDFNQGKGFMTISDQLGIPSSATSTVPTPKAKFTEAEEQLQEQVWEQFKWG